MQAGGGLWVGKDAFDHALAIIEGAVDLDGGDVTPQGGDLPLLQVADPAPPGVEDYYLDVSLAVEGGGDGGPSVAGGSGQDQGAGFASSQVLLQGIGQERGPEVLERTGRTVEELEDGVAAVYDAQPRRERIDVGAVYVRGVGEVGVVGVCDRGGDGRIGPGGVGVGGGIRVGGAEGIQ